MKTGNAVIDTLVGALIQKYPDHQQYESNGKIYATVKATFDFAPLQIKDAIWKFESSGDKASYEAKLAKRYGGSLKDMSNAKFISKMSRVDKTFLGFYDCIIGASIQHPDNPDKTALPDAIIGVATSGFKPNQVI